MGSALFLFLFFCVYGVDFFRNWSILIGERETLILLLLDMQLKKDRVMNIVASRYATKKRSSYKFEKILYLESRVFFYAERI